MKRNITLTLLLLLSVVLLIGCAPAAPAVSEESAVEEVSAPEVEAEEVVAEPTAAPEAAEEAPAEEVVEEAASEEAASEEAPAANATPRPAEEIADGFFINMTTDNIDRAAMAIGLATKVRKNTGKPVTIFFNTQGVRLVDVDIPQNTHKSGSTIHEMIQMFMDEGGVALVCPVCMKNVGGMESADILPGVIIGTPEFTWSAMFAENVTVLSY